MTRPMHTFDEAEMTTDMGAASVIEKVRRLIETMAAHGPLGLTALARESGISKTTVHRLCGELVEWGVVERSAGVFQLGARLAELGDMTPSSESLAEVGHPYLAELFAAFRLTFNLSVPHGTRSVRCVDKIWAPGRDHSSFWMGIGTRAPMHCTATGKAILAFSPPEVLAAVLSEPLVAMTPYTISGPDRLTNEIAEIRRTGVAWVRNEIRMDSSAIAVPIVMASGKVVGAISAGVTGKVTAVGQLETAMKTQARRIAATMH
ncbi:IclR family transcriptional regulator [Jatrophihabitans sp. YIM 134969]